jgi:recombination protein RecR
VSGRDPIQRLVRALTRLPGVGEKTATRLAFHVLRAPDDLARELSQALCDVKERVRLCSRCMNLTEEDPCAICADPRRDDRLVCVVASPQDVNAIERTGGYRGRYHVLHGVLSPLDGIGPDDLRIRELLARLTPGSTSVPEEVILATSPNVEGEATALYLGKVLRPLGLRVTRIASGLQVGGELEYADGMTITRALDARRPL